MTLLQRYNAAHSLAMAAVNTDMVTTMQIRSYKRCMQRFYRAQKVAKEVRARALLVLMIAGLVPPKINIGTRANEFACRTCGSMCGAQAVFFERAMIMHGKQMHAHLQVAVASCTLFLLPATQLILRNVRSDFAGFSGTIPRPQRGHRRSRYIHGEGIIAALDHWPRTHVDSLARTQTESKHATCSIAEVLRPNYPFLNRPLPPHATGKQSRLPAQWEVVSDEAEILRRTNFGQTQVGS